MKEGADTKTSQVSIQEYLDFFTPFLEQGKDIVLLNWEDLTRKSEGRVAYAWLFGMSMDDADRRDLERVLAREKLGVDDRMFEL